MRKEKSSFVVLLFYSFLRAVKSEREGRKKMGHYAAVWDHKAATEITKDWNGIDQLVLRNPHGASLVSPQIRAFCNQCVLGLIL